MTVGLFFGSFNPIHTGHLIMANLILEDAGLDQVWFVVSPQNPFKRAKSLAHEFDRLDMVRAAIEGNYRFAASDVEFNMPKPSYTVDTLVYLKSKHPDVAFKVLMGQDNLTHIHKWKNYKVILDDFGLVVYPRGGKEDAKASAPVQHHNIKHVQSPLLHISATMIRQRVRDQKSIQYIVPSAVADIILSRKLYL